RAAGLLSGYRNIEGAYVETSNTAKRAVLEGLGLQIADSASARRTLEELRSRAALPLDQIVVATELEPCHISIRVIREIATLEIRVTDESGVSRSIPCEVRRQDGNSVLITPPFERGYYRLSLRTKAAEAATTLIVAP